MHRLLSLFGKRRMNQRRFAVRNRIADDRVFVSHALIGPRQVGMFPAINGGALFKRISLALKTF